MISETELQPLVTEEFLATLRMAIQYAYEQGFVDIRDFGLLIHDIGEQPWDGTLEETKCT